MDIISDLLNQIRNAQAVSKETVEIPFSNFKYEIAKILEKEKFVEKVEKKGKKTKRSLEITLKYLPEAASPKESREKTPAISSLKRISRPGQRIYLSAKKVKKVKGGYGIAIISTPQGLMTDQEARKKKLGGEIIAEIW